MAEKMAEVYGAYDLQINQVMRGRGAFVLRTDKGIFQIKPMDVNPSRLEAEYEFKESLAQLGFDSIDYCVKNVDGELYTCDRYGNPYVMRRFFLGRECNPQSYQDIVLGVRNLAKLHQVGRKAFEKIEKDVHIRVTGDFKKRNQSLKRVNNYILRQKSKREFEMKYLKTFDYFYQQGNMCQREFEGLLQMERAREDARGLVREETGENVRGEAAGANREMAIGAASEMAAGANREVVAGDEKCGSHLGYCHGMYNHHSIVITSDAVGTISFDKFYLGNQLDDLYHYARKMVEKNDHSFSVLTTILDEYGAINPLSREDYQYIYINYCYPEKLYKLGNQYMNGSKSWLSPKLLEKMNKFIQDEGKKQEILDRMQKMYL